MLLSCCRNPHMFYFLVCPLSFHEWVIRNLIFSNSLEYEITFFWSPKVSHMVNSKCMLEYGWVGPRSWDYQGLQAHEVFQDLIKIYQSSCHCMNATLLQWNRNPNWSFSYLKIEFVSLKLLSVFIRKRKQEQSKFFQFSHPKGQPLPLVWGSIFGGQRQGHKPE